MEKVKLILMENRKPLGEFYASMSYIPMRGDLLEWSSSDGLIKANTSYVAISTFLKDGIVQGTYITELKEDERLFDPRMN